MSPITDNGVDAPSLPPANSVGSPEIIDGSVGVIDLSAGVQSEFVNETGDTMTGQLRIDTVSAPLEVRTNIADTYPRMQLGSNGFNMGAGGGSPLDLLLYRAAAGRWGMSPTTFTGEAAAQGFQTSATPEAGEANPAWQVLNDGQIEWGDDTNPADTLLSRVAANTLSMGAGDTLRIQQAPVVDFDVANKKYVDDALTTADGDFVNETGDTMTGALVMDTDNVGDANPVFKTIKTSTGFKGFTIDALGTMTWSDTVTGVAQVSLTKVGSTNLQLNAGKQISAQQDPVGAGDLSRKEYVDVRDRHARQLYVSVAGTAAIDGYRTVVVNVTGPVTAQLPAFPLPGHHVTIKRMSASGGGNLVTIDGNGRNIDNTATKTLNSQYSALTVEYNSNMNQWVIL